MAITLSSQELTLLRMLAESTDDETILQTLKIEKHDLIQARKNLLKKVGVSDPLQAMQTLAKKGFEVKG